MTPLPCAADGAAAGGRGARPGACPPGQYDLLSGGIEPGEVPPALGESRRPTRSQAA